MPGEIAKSPRGDERPPRAHLVAEQQIRERHHDGAQQGRQQAQGHVRRAKQPEDEAGCDELNCAVQERVVIESAARRHEPRIVAVQAFIVVNGPLAQVPEAQEPRNDHDGYENDSFRSARPRNQIVKRVLPRHP